LLPHITCIAPPESTCKKNSVLSLERQLDNKQPDQTNTITMGKDSKPKGNGGQLPQANSNDSRFSSFENDPRHRRTPKQHAKTVVDKRFTRHFDDEKGGFASTVQRDAYGRKIRSDADKKRLERLYRTEEHEEAEDDNAEIDDDEVRNELRAAAKKYDPARGGGFECSSESESDEDVDESAFEDGAVDGQLADGQVEIEEGEVTRRLAVVNMDWDHIKAQDLFALFASFIPGDSHGAVEKVAIYPSEYGKERIQREDFEGPPKDIFEQVQPAEDDEENSDSGEDEEIRRELLEGDDDEGLNSDALRTYQLDRLKYYYAVVECSDRQVAQELYESIDGTEYLSSSNFLDLRFVPDDTTFDDKPRDTCTQVSDGYEPVEFVTTALQSSKVKLTWDIHPDDAVRKQGMQKAFAGKKEDLVDADLRNYLASDSDEDGDAGDEFEGGAKLSKKELERRKLREALGLPAEPVGKKGDSALVGDMQITFASALTGKSERGDGAAEKEETTLEKYKRREKERKEKKRQKAKAKRGGAEQVGSGDDGDDGDDGDHRDERDVVGFDDPFFMTEDAGKPSKSAIRKEERRKKREAKEAAEAEKAAETERLRDVMGVEGKDGNGHDFDLRAIIKAEKERRKMAKKTKKGKAHSEADEEPEDAGIEVDERFAKALASDPNFSLAGNKSRFAYRPDQKKLEEAIRKRKGLDGGVEQPRKVKKAKGGR
jgi:hypothetical protein